MSYELNEKVKDLVPYAVDQKRGAIYMNANESFLPVHPSIKKEIISLTRKVSFNRYPDTLALKCCQAFAAFYGIDPALVTAGAGSDELISILLGCFFSKGEKLLVTEPDFSMYAFYADMAELEKVCYQKTEDYRIEPEVLVELARKEGCRGLIFSNPCNPTSRGLRKGQIRMLLKALPDMLVILDEAYMDFWNQSLLGEIGEYDNLIILRTASKAMGGAGIRLGFAVGQQKLTKALQAAKSPYNVSSITQAAGTAIFKHPDILKDATMEILAGRGFLTGALTRMEAEWKDSPYAFHMIPEPKTNFVIIRFLAQKKNAQVYGYLKKKKILVRLFPDFLRVTVGSAEENQRFLSVLAALQEGADAK